ncbi:MAG TPA: type II CAAX endopeptidase family protein [Thermoanaerobaculia bacterium]|nr:type II CAAX endopeptidase family protein [Thermoanaerobaculia bacterium]
MSEPTSNSFSDLSSNGASPYQPPRADLTQPAGFQSPLPRPQSAWKILGYTLVIFLAYSILQVVFGLLAAFALPHPEPSAPAPGSAQFGGLPIALILGVGTLVAAPFGIGAIVLVVRYQFLESTREYLALRRPSVRQALLWTLVLALFVFVFDMLGQWLERPEIPEFMRAILAGRGPKVMLWLAVVVAAPVLEEILFRGFLLGGLARTRLGGLGAVAVSSVLFGIIHTQYDLFDMSAVLALGAVLGLSRLYSGSTWLPVALHTAHNFVSMALTTWYLQQGG